MCFLLEELTFGGLNALKVFRIADELAAAVRADVPSDFLGFVDDPNFMTGSLQQKRLMGISRWYAIEIAFPTHDGLRSRAHRAHDGRLIRTIRQRHQERFFT